MEMEKKRILILWMIVCMMLSVVACGNEGVISSEDSESKVEESNATSESEKTDDASEKTDSATEDDVVGLEKLKENLMSDVEDVINALYAEYEILCKSVDTYEKYLENTETVKVFYEKINKETTDLCILLREYSVDYANEILASDATYDEKYDDFELVFDDIYEDAGDEIFDEIYDGILDEAFDDFYDGIIGDAYDISQYKTWVEVRSNEYEMWLECRSDVYKTWLDCRSDVYDFFLDMRKETWSNDIERAREKLEDFVEDINKLSDKAA